MRITHSRKVNQCSSIDLFQSKLLRNTTTLTQAPLIPHRLTHMIQIWTLSTLMNVHQVTMTARTPPITQSTLLMTLGVLRVMITITVTTDMTCLLQTLTIMMIYMRTTVRLTEKKRSQRLSKAESSPM